MHWVLCVLTQAVYCFHTLLLCEASWPQLGCNATGEYLKAVVRKLHVISGVQKRSRKLVALHVDASLFLIVLLFPGACLYCIHTKGSSVAGDEPTEDGRSRT